MVGGRYLHGIFHRPFTFPYDAQIGQNTKDFLKKSLTVEEDRRMGWQEVFSHPLIAAKQAGNSTERVEVDDYVRRIYQKLQHYGQKLVADQAGATMREIVSKKGMDRKLM